MLSYGPTVSHLKPKLAFFKFALPFTAIFGRKTEIEPTNNSFNGGWQLKRLLEELTGEKAPGPTPSFTAVHAIKALELIAKEPIGRNRLSKELALGEGATRTLIERFKDHGLITADRTGCALTKNGESMWRALYAVSPRKTTIGRSRLTLGRFNVAVLVKEGASKVRSGMEQRDMALIAGAKGATTLLYSSGRLAVPPEQRDATEEAPEICKALIEQLKPADNDAVVIGSADTPEKAEYGALAAALSFID